VQTLDDALSVHHALEAGSARRAVVVGGGYIGLEMAVALRMRDLDVTLVERTAQPMCTLDPDMGELILRALRAENITVHTGEAVTGVDTRDGAVRAVLTDQRTIPTDLVILGLGVRPNVALAQAAGSPSATAAPSAPTTGCAPVWKACGRPGIAWRSSTGSPAGVSRWHFARMPSRKAGPRGSTSVAATPPFPASWAPRCRRSVRSRWPGPGWARPTRPTVFPACLLSKHLADETQRLARAASRAMAYMGGAERRKSRRAVGPESPSMWSTWVMPRIIGIMRPLVLSQGSAAASQLGERRAKHLVPVVGPQGSEGDSTLAVHDVDAVGFQLELLVQRPVDVVHGVVLSRVGLAHVQGDEGDLLAELLVEPLQDGIGIGGHGAGHRAHGQQQRLLAHEVAFPNPATIGRRQVEVGHRLTRPRPDPKDQVLEQQAGVEVWIPVNHGRVHPTHMPANTSNPGGVARDCRTDW
jgi:hypothetical protein